MIQLTGDAAVLHIIFNWSCCLLMSIRRHLCSHLSQTEKLGDRTDSSAAESLLLNSHFYDWALSSKTHTNSNLVIPFLYVSGVDRPMRDPLQLPPFRQQSSAAGGGGPFYPQVPMQRYPPPPTGNLRFYRRCRLSSEPATLSEFLEVWLCSDCRLSSFADRWWPFSPCKPMAGATSSSSVRRSECSRYDAYFLFVCCV